MRADFVAGVQGGDFRACGEDGAGAVGGGDGWVWEGEGVEGLAVILALFRCLLFLSLSLSMCECEFECVGYLGDGYIPVVQGCSVQLNQDIVIAQDR